MNQRFEAIKVQAPLVALRMQMDPASFVEAFTTTVQELSNKLRQGETHPNALAQQMLDHLLAEGIITSRDFSLIKRAVHLLDPKEQGLTDVTKSSDEIDNILAEMTQTGSTETALVIMCVASQVLKRQKEQTTVAVSPENQGTPMTLRANQGGALAGAIIGAGIGGSIGGPIGAAIGAALGGLFGWLDS